MPGFNFLKQMKFCIMSVSIAMITATILYTFRSAVSEPSSINPSTENNAQIIRSVPLGVSKPDQKPSETGELDKPVHLNNTIKIQPTNAPAAPQNSQPAKEQTSTVKQEAASEGHASTDVTSEELMKIHKILYEFGELTDSHFFREPSPGEPVEDCPAIPQNLVGAIKVYMDLFPISELNSLDWYVKPGGSYAPQYCKQQTSVAIVIPYRNREEHLAVLLLNLHPFLQKQQRDYTIFIVNQVEGSKFNRALLMNIGFWEAMKKRKYDCIIFHDVDLIPENDRNIYNCPDDNPRHMSVAIDKFKYQLPYANILGGIVAVRWDIMMTVNGYSNQFFGWGGEDDDFSARMRNHKFLITRYPNKVARYKMIKHDKDAGNEPNKERFNMLKHVKSREDHDGINSLTYKLKSIEENPLYTQINIEIDQAEVMNAPKHSLADFPYTSNIWKKPAS